MKAIDILQNLRAYEELLEELHSKETLALQETKGFVKLTRSLSSQYNFITLCLNICTSEDKSGKEYEERLYCQISFEKVRDTIVFKELYHENPVRKEVLAHYLAENNKLVSMLWEEKPKNAFYYSEEAMVYIKMADKIAAVAYNCASGDDYRPGYFSTIQLGEGVLRMSQVNHMNSRSLNHKDNYSLRKLEFLIPLGKPIEEKRYDEQKIGEMKIYFSDSSSSNNRRCGDAIQEKIDEALATFKK